MQAEVQAGKEAAEWLTGAGLAGVVFILGCVIAGLLRKEPWLVPGSLHRERIASLEAQILKAEAKAETWQKLTIELLTPLEAIAGRSRPERRG